LATDAIPQPVVCSCITGFSTGFALLHNQAVEKLAFERGDLSPDEFGSKF
jgi:hypothetical protein